MVYLCFIFPRHKMEVFMKDVSILNEMIFSASTENELQEKFKDIYHRINNESEYDDSGSVEFLPLPRLNSHSERSEVQDIISGNDSNLLIVFYVQIMPDDFVMQLHRF